MNFEPQERDHMERIGLSQAEIGFNQVGRHHLKKHLALPMPSPTRSGSSLFHKQIEATVFAPRRIKGGTYYLQRNAKASERK